MRRHLVKAHAMIPATVAKGGLSLTDDMQTAGKSTQHTLGFQLAQLTIIAFYKNLKALASGQDTDLNTPRKLYSTRRTARKPAIPLTEEEKVR